MRFEKRKQRFSIRKFSFGAASVLLGTVVFGIAIPTSRVSADEQAGNQTQVVEQPPSSELQSNVPTVENNTSAVMDNASGLATAASVQSETTPANGENSVTPVEEVSVAPEAEETVPAAETAESVVSTEGEKEVPTSAPSEVEQGSVEKVEEPNIQVDSATDKVANLLSVNASETDTQVASEKPTEPVATSTSTGGRSRRAARATDSVNLEAPTVVAKDAPAPYNTMQILANMPSTAKVTIVEQGSGVSRIQYVGSQQSADNKIWGGDFNTQLDPTIGRAAPSHGGVTI